MLSAKADDEGGSPIKRKSMLSKTIKAIGKVKPKFKKKKGPKMELMDSVDDLDFELSDLERSDDENSDEEDDDIGNIGNDGETQPIQEEEGQLHEQEQVDTEEQEEPVETEEVNLDEEIGVETPDVPAEDAPDDSEKLSDSKRHNRRRTVERNGSSSSSKPRSSRRESRSIDPKEEAEGTPTTPSVRKRSTRSGSGNLTSLSPLPQKTEGHPEVPGLSRKTSIQRRSTPRSPMPSHLASPKASSSGDESLGRNTPTSQSRHRKVDQDMLVSPKISSHLLVQIPTESQNSPSAQEKEGEIDNSLRRCSKAFAEDEAMGGYFAKIQDLKIKSEQGGPEPEEPESTSPAKDDKSGKHHFKPSKNIRKLFGLKRSHSKDGTKSSPSNDKSQDDDTGDQDEASKLMKEISSMLSPSMGEHTFTRAHSARQIRTTHAQEDDEDDDDESTPSFFPDIPTAKKTSLSDIRRSVEETRGDRAGRGAPNRQLCRKQDSYSRRQSINASQKEDGNDKPTSSRKMSSKNLAADGGIECTDKEKPEASPGPSEDTSEHRRSRPRISRRSSTEHSKLDGRTTPTPEQEKLEDEPEIAEANSETQNNPIPSSSQPHNNHRRRRGQHLRSGNPTPEAIPEETAETEQQERPSSPGSLRSRRTSHRRSAEEQVLESEEHERPPSPGSLRARRSSHRRNSGDHLHEIAEQERPPSPGSLRARRSAHRSNSTGELAEMEEQERPSSPGSLRSRRSSNRRLSDDQTPESDEIERSSTPGILRHKRSQHRRNHENPPSETSETGNAQGSPGSLRSRKTAQRRSSDNKQAGSNSPQDGSHHKTDNATGDETRKGRPVSMSNLGKPPTNPSRRRLPRGSSENKLASGTSKKDIEQELLAIVRNPSLSENKAKEEGSSESKARHDAGALPETKAPSLAESLERGSLDRMLFNDGQYSVITEGSEMIVKGNISYSAIRSDASVAAPQLVFNPEDVNSGVQVKNV